MRIESERNSSVRVLASKGDESNADFYEGCVQACGRRYESTYLPSGGMLFGMDLSRWKHSETRDVFLPTAKWIKKTDPTDRMAVVWWNMRSCKFPCTGSEMDPKQASKRVVMAVVWWKI